MTKPSTTEWLRKADEDLAAARALAGEQPSVAAYHAQQAAEKCIRAYLTEKGVRFPREHDLGTLSRLEPRLRGALAPHTAALSTLTAYEAECRHPGYPRTWIDRGEAEQAVRWAEEIRGVVYPLLDLEP